MDFDPVAYLAAKGRRGRSASGGREAVYACFFDCEEPADSKKLKLYLNVAEGVYDCKVCGASGGTWTLQKHFGDEPRSGTNNDAFMRQRILDSATQVGVDSLLQNDDALLYLMKDRGLSTETIIERRFGFIAGGWSLTGSMPEDVTIAQLKTTGLVHREGPREGKDFFFRHLLIPIRRRGHTIQVRGRAWGESRGGKYMTGPGEPTRIYNADSLDGADEAIVTEGEFDAAILHQALAESTEPRLQRMAVIALPGTQAVPDDFDDAIAHLKRVYIGLDPDEAGRKGAEALKERIGSRARILQLPVIEGRKNDWTEFLLPAEGSSSSWKYDHAYAGHTWRDVLRLISHAAGKRIFSIFESGEAARTRQATHDGLATGYLGLDQTIKPGLLPGQVVVVLAKTGAGKTLWLCNLAYNMRAQRVLFLSLEMTREEIYDRLRRIYLFHHPRHTDTQVENALQNIYICDENRLGERDIGVLVNEFDIEADGKPDVVFVDYLGYFARSARGGSPYEKVSNAVMQLKAEAKAGRFVLIIPSQVNRGAKEGKPIDVDDARESGVVEETADFLLALFRPDDALAAEGLVNNQQPSGKVKLSILKSRHGGKGKVFNLQMDLLCLAVVDDNTSAAKRATDDNYLAWRGHDWDYLRRQQTRPRQMHLEGLPHGTDVQK
jgi:archaellum biogenesis ATPase FlaH